jgi:CheY-like chemotaxis protein/HPt (histidine-containing phosphotransfer) domain-containing protein
LSVTSEYGKGSVFTLAIDAGPMEAIKFFDPKTQAAPAQKQAESAPVVHLKPSRILVVEDGTSNQRLISIVLTRAGVSIELANNGQIGFDKAIAGNFDVILMDMQMPVMDGFTATRKLRDQGVKSPIIALTANAMKGEEEKCRAAGCSGYLSKPINVDLLLRTLAELVGERTDGQPSASPQKVEVASPQVRKAEVQALESSLPIEDPDFLEIVQEFSDRLHDQLGKMQHAWEQQELSELASLAHWLKGSGGTAGFAAFTSPAAKLEKLAKEKQTDQIAAALADVCDLGRRVVRPEPKTAPANSGVNA